MIPCPYHHGGECALGWYGGRPGVATCLRCLETGRKGEGLGDTVARVIHTVTAGRVKPCGGCHRRRELLNRIAPKGILAKDLPAEKESAEP